MTEYKIITYRLPSQYKSTDIKDSEFVKRRAKVTKHMNEKHIRLGTSLFAVNKESLKETKDLFDEVYEDEEFDFNYNFNVVGVADEKYLKDILKNRIEKDKKFIEDTLKGFEYTDKERKLLKGKVGSLIDLTLRRINDYETISNDDVDKGYILSAMTRRKELLKEMKENE